MAGATVVRVASVPAGHPYVAHLTPPQGSRIGGPTVVRLPDPPVPGAPPGQWWPSPWLDPDVVRAERHRIDVLHVHFGFEHRSPGQLAEWVATLRRLDLPLVLTVHDLRNPHQLDPRPHDAALDVLVAAAAEIVTLTPSAAADIARRWGRKAMVAAHPHVVDLDAMGTLSGVKDGAALCGVGDGAAPGGPGNGAAPGGPGDGAAPGRPGDPERWVVGLHARSERVNHASVAVARVLADAVADLPGASLRVDANDDPGGRAVAAALGDVDVAVHPRFGDAELWRYLAGLDASVLPYRFGTHSGWLEACHDLGTAAVAPDCGHYEDQGPCHSFHHDLDGLDAGSLAAAVRNAWRQRPAARADPFWRRAQRVELAVAHRDLYLRVLAAGSAGAGR